MKEEKRRYNVWTIGCQMNEADSRHLSSCLEGFGYAPSADTDQADLVVLNTCVVRESAEKKVRGKLQYLAGLKKQRPDLRIVLMGCFVGRGKNQDRLKEQYPFVDIFMPPSDISPLTEHLDSFRQTEADPPVEESMSGCNSYQLPSGAESAVSANVPAVLGCSHACTYCVIPYRRGREHSRPRENVLAEVRGLAAQGVKEVVILGQIIDRYGVDFEDDYDLADLLDDTAAVKGVESIRFLTSHPKFMTDRIIDAVARNDKVCPHFELPCQAGNDEILEKMRRGYNREQFYSLIDRIRNKIPHAAINTDIIVGFPGEDEEQFRDTRLLLEDLRFDTVHIAKYSPRPQTYAARHLEDDVAEEEKERRRVQLDQIQKDIQTQKNAELLDKDIEVLVESRDQRHGRWRGRTAGNKLVFIEDADELLGQIVTARITWTGPFSMLAVHNSQKSS